MNVSAPFEPAICVRDFDAAVSFYRDVLEMRMVQIVDIAAAPAEAARLARGGYRIARLDSEGGDRLKIVAPLTPPPPVPPVEEVMMRPGLAYLTFIVPDLRRVMARIEVSSGRLFSGPAPVPFRPGVVDLCFALDPEGTFLEFVQRNDLDTYRPAPPPAA